MDALEKAINNLFKITNIAFVGYTDELGEVVEELSPEDVKKINHLAYKTAGYLIALKTMLENPEEIADERFNKQLLYI